MMYSCIVCKYSYFEELRKKFQDILNIMDHSYNIDDKIAIITLIPLPKYSLDIVQEMLDECNRKWNTKSKIVSFEYAKKLLLANAKSKKEKECYKRDFKYKMTDVWSYVAEVDYMKVLKKYS